MSWYLWIKPLQEPFDPGLAPPGSAQLTFNVAVMKTPSATFEEELIKVLTDASVGTLNTNIFGSTHAMIPTGSGPYLTVIPSGGLAPARVQNAKFPRHVRPSAQINVLAGDFVSARTMAFAAYNALASIVNVDVTP